VNVLISQYLFTFINTLHWITGECPSIILFGRKMRTRLDLSTDFGERSKEQENIIRVKEK